MKKEDMIKKLIELGVDESKQDLRKKTNKELSAMLRDAERTEKEDHVEDEYIKHLDPDRLVPVMSIFDGVLSYGSEQYRRHWVFRKLGQKDKIPLGEIQTAMNVSPSVFARPHLVILDEEVVKYLGLEDVYKFIDNEKQLMDIFNLSMEEFKEIVENAPDGLKEMIVSRAIKEYDSGELYDMRKIRLIEDTYDVEIVQK